MAPENIIYRRAYSPVLSQLGYYIHISQSLALFNSLHVVGNGLQLLVSYFANFIYNPGPTIT